MSFFSKLFGSKPREDTPLLADRLRLNLMAEKVIEVSRVDVATAVPLDRALLGTFLFGMVNAHGMSKNLTPPQVHALTVAVFIDAFGYDPQSAVQAADDCIRATEPGYHDAMNSIIHRGIDGHLQFVNKDFDGLRKNVGEILTHYRMSFSQRA